MKDMVNSKAVHVERITSDRNAEGYFWLGAVFGIALCLLALFLAGAF